MKKICKFCNNERVIVRYSKCSNCANEADKQSIKNEVSMKNRDINGNCIY